MADDELEGVTGVGGLGQGEGDVAAADAGLIGVAGVGCLEVCDDALAGRESRQLIRDGLDPGQGRHIGLTGEEACFGEHPQAGGEVAGDHRAAPLAGRPGGV